MRNERFLKNLARSGGRNAYFPISPGHFDAVPAARWRSYPGTEGDERPNPSTFAGSLQGRTAAGPATPWQHSPEPDRVLGGLAACFARFWGGSDSIPERLRSPFAPLDQKREYSEHQSAGRSRQSREHPLWVACG